MRTVDFSRILREASGYIGIPKDEITAEDFEMLRAFMDERLRIAWEMESWPDVQRIEKRYFRPFFDASTTYAAGDQIYEPVEEKYYIALQGSTGQRPPNLEYWAELGSSYNAEDYDNTKTYQQGDRVYYPQTNAYYQAHTQTTGNAPTDTAFWGKLEPFIRSIDFLQDGETPIGEVHEVTDKDPRVTYAVERIPYRIWHDSIIIVDNRNFVWISFRKRPPELIGESWSSSATYSSGDQVYFEDSDGIGNFYTANTTTSAGESPESASSKWDVVPIPYIFKGYMAKAAYADWLRLDGQQGKADAAENWATSELNRQGDKLFRQQGQDMRISYSR